MGQTFAESARSGAINQAGEIGVAVGAGAASLGGQALQRVGGAVRDGAVRALDWETGALWRAADEVQNVILNPMSWRQNTGIEALRRPLLSMGAEAAEVGATEAGAGIGAMEGESWERLEDQQGCWPARRSELLQPQVFRL